MIRTLASLLLAACTAGAVSAREAGFAMDAPAINPPPADA